MSHSEQINEIAAALAKAQAEIESAKFDAINPHFKNKYATLASVREACKPLSKYGIAYTQTKERVLVGDAQQTELFLRTMLIHSSGQWIDSYYPLPGGAKPQEFGSALTYARRYSLSAIVGIASDEDDDANAASQPSAAKPSTGTSVSGSAGKPLNRDQIDAIEFYVKELSVDRVRAFLNWMNIKTMTQITQANYDTAIAGLKKATGLDLGTGAGGSKGGNQAVSPETADEAAAAE